MSGEVTAELLVQIRALVERELQRQGRPSKPRIEGHFLVVGKGATEARADLQGSVEQWESLPDDLRERRVQQIAHLLGEGAERAPSAPRQARQRRANRPGFFSFLTPLLIVALTGAALIVAYRSLAPDKDSALTTLNRWLNRGPAPSPSASAVGIATHPSDTAGPDPGFNSVVACANARARVARGGVIGPADGEGWQVELALLRRGSHTDLSQDPALARFVRRARGALAGPLIWTKASSLIAQERFDAQVEVRPIAALGQKNVSGVSLVFSGPYVVPYFSEDQRAEYFMLADALADALAANDGALFAHCADSDSHHVGSWFLGATPGAAIASLIFFMESYSDMPVLKPDVLGTGTVPERRGHAFDAIEQATGELSRNSVATLLGNELGMISGRPNKPARLTFPFRDGNRASRAGLEAARSLGLASSR